MSKILIIDDEKDIGGFVKKFLELTPGFRVIVATNGHEGLNLAAREKPDLILLDIIMPRMDGFAVLKALKDNLNTTAIPVIMLTALDTDEAKEKTLSLYHEDYIVKPFKAEELKAKIEDVLSRRAQ